MEQLMSEHVDAFIKTIMSKIGGMAEARKHLPVTCITCGKELEPVDVGVDPVIEQRVWTTWCCNNFDTYIQKVGPQL